jgi:CO dehydrogenase/acetyl-CoA synthase epsilon subunit
LKDFANHVHVRTKKRLGAPLNCSIPDLDNWPSSKGAYVFKVDATGFTLLGTVSQYKQSNNYSTYTGNGNNFDITRTVVIGNYLYSISSDEVLVSDLSDFSTISTIALPASNQSNVVVVGVSLP